MEVRVGRRLALTPRVRFELGDAFDLVEWDANLGAAHGLDDEHGILLDIGAVRIRSGRRNHVYHARGPGRAGAAAARRRHAPSTHW
jgi:hypothetical protein